MRFPMMAMLVIVLPASGQHTPDEKEKKNPAIGNPAAIAEGAKLYAVSCAACHGPDGTGGRGPNLVRRSAWHPLTDDGIFSTVRHGVPGADMPPTKLEDQATWNLVAFVRALTAPASEAKLPGDPAEGEKVFWSAKAECSNCHAIRGRGSRTGPDLSTIGSTQPATLLRESILQPSKDSSFLGRESITVTLNTGTILTGTAKNRTNYSLQLLDAKGDLHLISMGQVKGLKIQGGSGMPDDYGKKLSAAELQNLIAYLARQTARPVEDRK